MIRPFTLLTMILAAASGAYLFSVKHQAQLLDDQLAAVAQQSRLDGQRIRVLQAQWALEIDPTRLSQLASQFTTLQPMRPAQLVTLAALRQDLPSPGVGAPEPNPEEPMPADLGTPSPDQSMPDTSAFSVTLAANGLPLPPPQMPPDIAPAELAPQNLGSPITKLAAADPSAGLAPSLPHVAVRRPRATPTRFAQNVTPPSFIASQSDVMPSLPRAQPIAAQIVSVGAPASSGLPLPTSNASAGAVATGGSMLGMAQDALAPPQPLGTDN